MEWRVKYRSEWVVERVGGGLEWSVVECGGLEWTGFKFRSGGGWIGVEGGVQELMGVDWSERLSTGVKGGGLEWRVEYRSGWG